MVIDPTQIVSHRATGTGDMGDATDPHSRCRWRVANAIYVPVYIRALFTSGTGSATLSVRKDDTTTDLDLYDFVLKEITDAGTGGEDVIALTILTDELKTFVLKPSEDLVLEWTNPDSGTMRWAVEVGLYDASQLGQV